MPILKSQACVGNYTVQSLIKSNLYTETYRVEDADGNPYFLKLFILKNLPQSLIDAKTKAVREIMYSSGLNHKNLLRFIEQGVLSCDEGQCRYYVTNYLAGSILSDKVAREGKLSQEEALSVFRAMLEGLRYLHTQSPALCHNDLDPSNILLSQIPDVEAQIIDYGHLSERCSGSVWFSTSDLDLRYHADENKVGVFDEQGDVFSACAVMYYMLTGKTPWAEASLNDADDFKTKMQALREYRKQHPLDFAECQASDKLTRILRHGLELKNINRFGSIDEIIRALDADEQHSEQKGDPSKPHEQKPDRGPNYVEFHVKKGTGNGFQDVAGMEELKESVRRQVIFVIKNKDIAKQYKITPPNGMLLYGPPGCGKSFFAEKFAEETGFNYLFVKSSDLASSFVHGSQDKINQMFETAEKHKPIVVCLDEFDALVPDRSALGSEYSAGEVNEFLTQLNNCSKRGIFIVATSNRPDKIDPAVLRTGRIDKMVYVPMPDFEARREMFSLYLKDRPQEGEIDLDNLAKLTEGYIASDIAYIVNDAAMVAAYSREKITSSLLEESVRNTHPSIRPDGIKIYEEIRRKMESTDKRNLTDRVRVQPMQ